MLWKLWVTQDRWVCSTGPALRTSFNTRNVRLVTISPSYQLHFRMTTTCNIGSEPIFLLEHRITVPERSLSDENRFSNHKTPNSYESHVLDLLTFNRYAFWLYGVLPPSEGQLLINITVLYLLHNAARKQTRTYTKRNDTCLHSRLNHTRYYVLRTSQRPHYALYGTQQYGTKTLCYRARATSSGKVTELQFTEVFLMATTITEQSCTVSATQREM